MSRRSDPNAPENWLKWLRGVQKDPTCTLCEIRGVPLGAITGTDARVLRAIANLWALCGYYPDDPAHQAALVGIRELLPCMQKSCWPFARELIAQQLDWHMRGKLWRLVVPDQRELARKLPTDPARGDRR